MQTCKRCGIEKSLENFHKRNGRKNHSRICFSCVIDRRLTEQFTCTKCSKVKPGIEFQKGQMENPIGQPCLECYAIFCQERYAALKKPPKRKYYHLISNVNEDTRKADCSVCGPGIAIYSVGSNVYTHWRCAELSRQKALIQRLRRYDLTVEQFEKMIEDQSGLCAVCFTKPEPRPGSFYGFHVDHDHNCCSGTRTCGQCTRGLLCNTCNSGLGMFKDNTKTLSNAIKYLSNE